MIRTAVIQRALRGMSKPDLMRVAAIGLFVGAAKMQSSMSYASIIFLLLGSLRVDAMGDDGFLLSLRGIPMAIFSIHVPRY